MLTQLSKDQLAELANLYHTAKILHDTNYKQMLYASKEFNKLYPEISSTSAYKALDRMQSWRY